MSVRGAIKIGESHAIIRRVLQRSVQRHMFLAPDDTYGRESKIMTSRRSRSYVVRVCATERQKCRVPLIAGCQHIVVKLAPFITRDLRMNEIITLEIQVHPAGRKTLITKLLNRRRQARSKESLNRHAAILYLDRDRANRHNSGFRERIGTLPIWPVRGYVVFAVHGLP